MASGYEQFYEHLTTVELAEERVRILKAMESLFSSQQVGSKSYQRSEEALQARMKAHAVETSRRASASQIGGGAFGQANFNSDYC